MSFFSLLSLVAASVDAFIGAYALALDHRSALNRTFFAACVAFFWWALFYVFMHSAPNRAFYARMFDLGSPGWIWPSAILLHFFLLLTNRRFVQRHRWVVFVLYLPAAALQIHALGGHRIFAKDFIRVPLGWYEVPDLANPWFIFLSIYFESYALVALGLAWRWGRHSRVLREKRQARLVIAYGIVAQACVTWDIFGWPLVSAHPVPTVANAMVTIWLVGVFLAISRYRLMALTPEAAATDILRTMSDAVLLIDRDGQVLSGNRAAVEMLGIHPEEIIGMPINACFTGDEVSLEWFEDVLAHAEERNRAVRVRTRSGAAVPVRASFSRVRSEGGELGGAVAVMRDVRDELHQEELLRHLAHHDPLTDLPNRALFNDRLSQSLLRAARTKEMVGVAFIDFDRFKEVNDTLGHEYGDMLLKGIARRLVDCLRKSDTASRMGGDEFAAILTGLGRPEDIEPLATRLSSVFAQPVLVGDRLLHITGSIGISLFPRDGDKPDVLMRKADMAMYAAKKVGGNAWQLFTEGVSDTASDRNRMELRLQEAFAHGELEIHYQPEVDIETGEVVAVESLLRWKDETGTLVSPTQFVPLAEESGLIVPMGEWVLREACAQAMVWRRSGLRPFRIAVNLAARQFATPGLVKMVASALKDSGLPPADLELEVTESTAMRDTEETARILDELHELGVRIALDDFGTGYSSLAYLRRFACDTLKIGQSFTHGVTEREDFVAILSAIFGLAHALKLRTVVAEGIESSRQVEILKTVRCRVVQGNLFGEPMSARQIEQTLRQRSEGPLAAAG